ncbi:uncharacterized protein LOC111045042 [Nilaparvata lugens]|uniref:uncharacterized protein LOC111045042 n=1 Tax=Nilaparvata lugens TaxID=108931 RepID=UPI00193D46C6|nr:uncharacterized protein LOC111045042 [Nilaparvata lugens]
MFNVGRPKKPQMGEGQRRTPRVDVSMVKYFFSSFDATGSGDINMYKSKLEEFRREEITFITIVLIDEYRQFLLIFCQGFSGDVSQPYEVMNYLVDNYFVQEAAYISVAFYFIFKKVAQNTALDISAAQTFVSSYQFQGSGDTSTAAGGNGGGGGEGEEGVLHCEEFFLIFSGKWRYINCSRRKWRRCGGGEGGGGGVGGVGGSEGGGGVVVLGEM